MMTNVLIKAKKEVADQNIKKALYERFILNKDCSCGCCSNFLLFIEA